MYVLDDEGHSAKRYLHYSVDKAYDDNYEINQRVSNESALSNDLQMYGKSFMTTAKAINSGSYE